MRWIGLVTALLWWGVAAVPAAPEAELAQRFGTSPAAAFQEADAWRRQRQEQHDLPALLRLLAQVKPACERYHYYTVGEDLIDAVVSEGRARSDWSSLAAAYEARLAFSRIYMANNRTFDIWLAGAGRRYQRHLELAREAYAKEGRRFDTDSPLREALSWTDLATGCRNSDAKLLAWCDPRYRPELDAALELFGEARDREAMARLDRVLQAVLAEYGGTAEQRGPLGSAAVFACHNAGLRGGEKLLATLSAFPYPPGDAGGRFNLIMLASGCAHGWSGANDQYLSSYYRVVQRLLSSPGGTGRHVVGMAVKLRAFGRGAEAERLLATLVTQDYRQRGFIGGASWTAGVRAASAQTPAPVRRMLLALGLTGAVQESGQSDPLTTLPMVANALRAGYQTAPATERANWAHEAARLMHAAVPRWPTAAGRARTAREAASFYREAGRPEGAAACEALAVQMEQDSPRARLLAALAVARPAAATGSWPRVEGELAPLLAPPPAAPEALEALLLLARARQAISKLAEAEASLTQLMGLLPGLRISPVHRLNVLVSAADLTREPARRLDWLRAAERIAESTGIALLQEQLNERIAAESVQAGNLAAAREALIDLVLRAEQRRQQLAFDPELRQQWFAANLTAHQRLLLVGAQLGDAEIVLWCGEHLRARVMRDQLAWRRLDLAVLLPPAMRARFNDLHQRRRLVYDRLRQAAALPAADDAGAMAAGPGPATTPDTAELRRLLDELAKEEAALEAAIREQVPTYRTAATAVQLPQTMLGWLPARSAHLAYHQVPDGLVGVAFGPDRRRLVRHLRVDLAKLHDDVGQYRQAIASRQRQAGKLAQELHETLVAPFAEVIKGARRLYVAADGVLNLLPFGALQNHDRRYLVEDLPVAMVPSLMVAAGPRTRAGRRRASTSGALVLAGPETNAAGATPPGDFCGQLLAMAAVALPGAVAEGQAIRSLLSDATLLSGPAATKEALQIEAGRRKVLHLATHGYADAEVPEYSGVLLASGSGRAFAVLTAAEVLQWQLDADLVALSACETGLGRSFAGEGLIGLTRAFLLAGARDVVSSLWRVPDDSTRELMTRFYGAWRAGQEPAKAMQSAQVALLGDSATRHPYHWAAFCVVQGPR